MIESAPAKNDPMFMRTLKDCVAGYSNGLRAQQGRWSLKKRKAAAKKEKRHA